MLCLASSAVLSDTVVSSIAPLGLLVNDLSPEPENSSVLITGMQTPHSQSLRLVDLKRIREASLFIWVGPRFESEFGSGISKYLSKDRELRLSDIPSLKQKLDESTSHAGHTHARDAHLWLSYENSIIIAREIVKRLTLVYPNEREQMQLKLHQLISQLENDRLIIKDRFTKYKGHNFGVYHDGYGELVDEFELAQIAHVTLVPDEQISLQQLVLLKNQLRDAACLLADIRELEQAKKIGARLDLKVIEIDLLANQLIATQTERNTFAYPKYLTSLMGSFEKCLIQ